MFFDREAIDTGVYGDIALVTGKKLFFYAITIVIVLICTELTSFFAVRFLQARGVFYKPSVSNAYEDYLLKRDNQLGWPSPDGLRNSKNFDSSGSRIIPAFADVEKHQTCISLYGDSFTWSYEVDHEFAWSNVLSTLVNCRVANYGVGGYGSDQAYLRFRQNKHDDSSVVFLNHLSENILRNVNQFRSLLYPGKGLGFKPRFIVNEEGDPELLPLPTFDPLQYKDVVLHPSKYFENEYFLPGGSSGTSVASFPYTISIFRSFDHFHVRAKLRREPGHLEFYKKKHNSGGLGVTAAILTRFHNDAIARGKVPIITIIPTGNDLSYYSQHKVWPYQSLIDDLSNRGISVLNFGEGIMSYVGQRNPCSLFGNCSAHFNEEGYKVLAQLAYKHLAELQLLERIRIQHRPDE